MSKVQTDPIDRAQVNNWRRVGRAATRQHERFWEAEPEHQDYLIKYPAGYTCHFARPDWVLPRRATTA